MPCAWLGTTSLTTWALLAVFTYYFARAIWRLVGAIGWLVGAQFYDLEKKLPQYQQTIETKFTSIGWSPNYKDPSHG